MPYKMKAKIEVRAYQLTAFLDSLKKLKAQKVLAGFPSNGKPREDEDGNPEPISNAALAYIHNFGAPEANIPARPFMREGVLSARTEITQHMRNAAVAALDGKDQQAHGELIAIGLAAQSGIQNKIINGPFEPLTDATLKARARATPSRQGEKKELASRAAGNAPGGVDAEGFGNVQPLNDSGQLHDAVTYIIQGA